MSRATTFWLLLVALGLAAPAAAEVIRLNNGDVIHGTLVAANNTEVRLKTPYGELTIPKKDIQRIDYEGAAPPAEETPREEASSGSVGSAPPRSDGSRAALSLQILGRSFWYAFDSPPEAPRDTSIRLRLYVGSDRACTFVDSKPDTVDGATLYNSFTFSATDAQLAETGEGYDCRIEKAQDGAVVLRVVLPTASSSGLQTVRMLYEVNEGTASTPRWIDAVSRSFSAPVAPGKDAVVVLEQNADALEYTGFFKKKMKNVELFQLDVLSTELKD